MLTLLSFFCRTHYPLAISPVWLREVALFSVFWNWSYGQDDAIYISPAVCLHTKIKPGEEVPSQLLHCLSNKTHN